MEQVPKNEDSLKIVRLYLEKIEILNERERATLIKTIEILNNPLFVVPGFKQP